MMTPWNVRSKLAIATCVSLMALAGTAGCGGAGTPGLSPTINRPPDTNADATGRSTTIPTGRMGVFLTATTNEAAPTAAEDDGPTSADVPAETHTDTAADTKKDKNPTPAPAPKPDPAKPDVVAAAPTASPDETAPPAPAATNEKNGKTTVVDAAPAQARAKTTDAAQTYNHIWATISKVELIDARDNSALTVWEGDAQTFDLQTLHDKNGRRFSLITSAAIPSGRSYERVRLTLGSSMELFTPGSTTGTVAPLSDTLARDSEGRPIVSFALARPRDLGTGKDNLFIDFDLRKLQVENGRVLPVVRESGSKSELIEGEGVASQQNPAQFAGVVTEWTPGKKAGDGAWTLALPSGKTVTVQTNDATQVWNDDGKPSPVLANSKRVRVSGRLDLATNRVIADVVSVYPAPLAGENRAERLAGDAAPTIRTSTAGLNAAVGSKTGAGVSTAAIALASEVAAAAESLASAPLPLPPAQVSGRITGADATAQSVTLTPREVGGLTPTQSAVLVQITPDALLRQNGKVVKPAEFFAALSQNPNASVRAEGDYETATGTLKASRVVIESATGGVVPTVHEVVVQGVPAKASVKNGSLQVANLTEWENFAASDGKNPVRINLTAATELRNESDTFIARENFFKAIETPDENGLQVRVSGVYANGVLTASHIALVAKTEAQTPPAVAQTDTETPEAAEATAPAQSPDIPAAPVAPPVPKNVPHLAPVLNPPPAAPPMPEIPTAPVVK